MITRAATAAILLTSMGCVPPPPAAGDGDVPPLADGNALCDASEAQALIGRTASQELGVEALRLTGARGLRWIQPGQAVTMDYRPDRLNIKLDEKNQVIDFSCG